MITVLRLSGTCLIKQVEGDVEYAIEAYPDTSVEVWSSIQNEGYFYQMMPVSWSLL